MDDNPPPGTPSVTISKSYWPHKGVRYLGILSRSGDTKELFYANGTSSKIRVTAKAGAGEFVSTEIAKLP